MNEDIKTLVNDGLENVLSYVYKKLNVTCGDITPEQSLLWDDIVNRTAILFNQLVEQNSPQDDEIQINVGYIPTEDTSIIFKETYVDGDCVSTEIVGWYYGEPNDDDTQKFIGKLKAEYTLGGDDNE